MAATKMSSIANESSPGYHFPFAAAPDIIRASQKDNFFQGVLLENLSGIFRKLYGAHFVHTHASEIQMLTGLLYFGCTTLLGNRTLGEEYCDLLQVEAGTSTLPSTILRSSYILSSVLLPYTIHKTLPSFRNRVRLSLETSLQAHRKRASGASKSSVMYRIQSYLRENLSNITSPSTFYAISLSMFYFSGAYYHISKRILGLRYVFTKEVEPSDQRMGYEVLSVLMITQMALQCWLHIRSAANESAPTLSDSGNLAGGSDLDRGPELDPSRTLWGTNSGTERESSLMPQRSGDERLATTANTPLLLHPRYYLADSDAMGWIQGDQQRKCTLCLENMKDPSVTTCGHVFCWTCVADWIKEKPECPLCRQTILSQHVLPMRSF